METMGCRWGLLVVCLAAACMPPPVVAPTGAVIRYPIATSAMPSGMRAVFETAPDFGVAGAVLVVASGSADEPQDSGGLAHLVEHLVMRSRHGNSTLERRLEALGASSYNAMTDWDETTYFAFGPTQSLSAVVKLLIEALDDPLAGIDETTFEHEKQIVKNEMLFRVENGTPAQAVGLLASEAFPGRHPYAHPVAGTETSIGHLTLDDAREFAKEFYHPERSVLIVSSPHSIDDQRELVSRAEAASGGSTASVPLVQPLRGQPPPETAAHALVTRELPVSNPTLWIGWTIPSRNAPESDVAALVSRMVLSVFWNHVYDHDRDIAHVQAGVLPGAQASLFYVEATLKEGDDPQRSADSVVHTMMRGLSEETYTGMRLSTHKRLLATDFLATEEPIAQRALQLARSMRMTGDPTFLRSRAERTIDIPSDQVADFCRRYLDADRAREVLIRPLSGGKGRGGAPPAASVETIRETPDAAGSSLAPTLEESRAWMQSPGIARGLHTKLANGLEVVVLPRPGSPFHSVIVAYHGGRANEATPGAGVASLWAKERLHGVSDLLGVQYREQVGTELTSEYLHATGTDLRPTLRLLHSENEFRIFWPPTQFISRIEALEKEDASPASVFERRLRNGLYGAHPLGRTTTAAALRAVKPNDVYSFLDGVRHEDNGIVVIVGDVDPRAAVDLIESEFDSPPSGQPGPTLRAVPPLDRAAAGAGGRLVVQDRRGSDDATMVFSCVLPKVGSDDAGAAWLFGVAVRNIFRNELRERTAASYDVSVQTNYLRGGSAVVEARSDVNPNHLPWAVQAVRRFVEQPAATLFDEKWLALARASAASGFNLSVGTTSDLAWRIVNTWNLGWPIDTLDRYPEQVYAAKLETLVRFAQHCQHNWVSGWLGDEGRIRDALAGWNP
jgi:zinc protease